MPKFIKVWTPGNTAYPGQFCSTFISLVNVPWWLDNQWCQINRWMGLHVTPFLPCMAAIIKPWHCVFRVRPWIHDSHTLRWWEACSDKACWWVPDSSCTKACWQLKSWCMLLSWDRSVFGIHQSWWAQVINVLFLSLSLFSPGHT
jgi:hypothetical protein